MSWIVLIFIWVKTKNINKEKMIKIICLINELFIENGSLEILKRVISPKVVNNVTIKYSLPKYSLDP